MVVVERTSSGSVVHDLDSYSPLSSPLGDYVTHAFKPHLMHKISPEYHCYFRVCPSALLLPHFASDRSRMMKDGSYMKPPPPYPPIVNSLGLTNNLDKYIDFKVEPGADSPLGPVMDVGDLLKYFH